MSCSMLGANQRVHEQCSSRAGTMRCPREAGLGFGLCRAGVFQGDGTDEG